MILSDKEKSIFQTICWFDIFNYPLTSWEIYKWGYKLSATNHQSVVVELKESKKLKEIISYKDGFYFLKWQDNNIIIRKRRYLLAEKKYKKALKIIKILALIPFVQAIAVATGLSYSNSKEEDDIDLFLIVQESKIWVVRFFSILVLKILKSRPTFKDKKDKICLNFFIDEKNLNLKNIMLTEENDLPDIYFIYWLAWLYPVYQKKDIWQKFIVENSWLKNYLPFFVAQKPIKSRQIILFCLDRILKLSLEIIFWPFYWNRLFSFLQKKIMPRQIKQLVNKSSSVIISNSILKFHDRDKRQEYRQKFYEKNKQIT